MSGAAFVLAALLISASPENADAMPAVGRAMDAWKVCVASNTREYSLSTTEPAQTVVEAGIGECVNEHQRVRLALFGLGSSPAEADETLRYMVDNTRPLLIAGVLRLRAAQKQRP